MSRRRDGATGQPLIEGVYEDVVTEQLARGLEASTIAYVVEELGDADAHVTLARHLGREIERALATLPRDRRAEQARVLAAGLLDHLATLVSEEVAELVRDQRPPPPRRLMAVHRGAVPERPATCPTPRSRSRRPHSGRWHNERLWRK